MPAWKLVIEYCYEEPIFPFDHVKMETGKYCEQALVWLAEFLILYSREGIITPIDNRYPLIGVHHTT
jgi:hypothetical protein